MEAVWIAAARQGDELAAAALFERYGPRLRRTVARWTDDVDTADDVCQEAWLRAFRALPGFRQEANFGTWIHTIARNLAIGRSRAADRTEKLRATHPFPTATPPDTIELRVDLQRAIDALPTGMRTVLLLHDVEGYKHTEIARSLGVAEGTSKSQLFKARAQIRKNLQQHNGTKAQNHNSTKAQQHKSTKAQQHNGTTAQDHNSTKAQHHKSTTAQQHNGTTAKLRTAESRDGAVAQPEDSTARARRLTIATAGAERRTA